MARTAKRIKTDFNRFIGTCAQLMDKFAEAGLSDDELEIPLKDPEILRRLVRYWQNGAYEATITQRAAQGIMRKNFLGPDEVFQYLKVPYTEEQLIELGEIPFAEGTLRKCKNTHILFAGYPLSLLDLKIMKSNLFYNQIWYKYKEEEFASEEKVELKWYLIRRDCIPESTSKDWQEQLAMLKEDEEIPRACEIVYMIILYYLARNDRLFKTFYTRCQDVASDRCRVCVGGFVRAGLLIYSELEDRIHDDLGIVSSKRHEPTKMELKKH